jgi:hypothetical protein
MSSLAVFYKELPWGRSRWTYGFHVICRRPTDTNTVFAAVHFYDQQGDKMLLIKVDLVERKDSSSTVNIFGISQKLRTETVCMNIFGWSSNCSSKEAPHRIYIENDREIMEVITDSIEMALTLQVPTPEPALSHADFRHTSGSKLAHQITRMIRIRMIPMTPMTPMTPMAPNLVHMRCRSRSCGISFGVP